MGQQPKQFRYYLHLPLHLLAAVDAWRHTKEIPSRAEALRQLILIALRREANHKKGQGS